MVKKTRRTSANFRKLNKATPQDAKKLVKKLNKDQSIKEQIAHMLVTSGETDVSDVLNTLDYNPHLSECYVKNVLRRTKREPDPQLNNFNVPSFRGEFNGDIFFCIHCDKLFSNVIKVQDHLGSEHNDHHYFCERCGDLLATNRQLINHQNIFRYYCINCDYATDHYRTYQTHCGRVHNIIIPNMRDLKS